MSPLEMVGNDLKGKFIYLCYVDKYIGAFNPHTGEVVGYEIRDKFVPFVQKILKENPEYYPHCVLNEGIEEVIRGKIQSDIRNRSILSNSIER